MPRLRRIGTTEWSDSALRAAWSGRPPVSAKRAFVQEMFRVELPDANWGHRDGGCPQQPPTRRVARDDMAGAAVPIHVAPGASRARARSRWWLPSPIVDPADLLAAIAPWSRPSRARSARPPEGVDGRLHGASIAGRSAGERGLFGCALEVD